MEVTKVIITRNYSLFQKMFFEGTVFYITTPYRRGSSTIDESDVFDEEGKLLGTIRGHWFDFANKTLFKKVDNESSEK